jgi:hypothetical protein
MVLLIAAAGLAYWYYTDTQARLQQLAADKAKLELAVQQQEETIRWMTEFQARQSADLNQLQSNLSTAEAERNKLTDLLSRHDLTTLARRKPQLIEDRMNAATQRVMRELRGDR